MAQHLYVVQSSAVPGREDEYNDWYTNEHLHDLVAIPGVSAAQRFRFARRQRDTAPPYPYSYLAIYELDADPQRVFSGIDAAKANGMRVSDAMAADRVSHLWEPICERVTRPGFAPGR